MSGFLFFGSSIFNVMSFGWSLNFSKSLRVSNSIIIEFALVCLIPFIFILSVEGVGEDAGGKARVTERVKGGGGGGYFYFGINRG